MKTSQIHLRETFKILTFEFISGIERMATLNGEHLLSSKQILFSKILDLLLCHQSEQSFEDYAKMLENSYDDNMKYECFQKDFSISMHNHSQQKDMHSDMESEIQDHPKDSFDDSTDKIKKEIFGHQRFADLTKYTGNPNEIFQYVDSFSDQCKKEESTPIQKLDLSDQIPESIVEKEGEFLKEQEDEQFQEIQPNEDDSSFTPQNESDEYLDEHQNKKNNHIYRARSISVSALNKKKYRSYTDTEKQQAIKYAFEMGFEFTSKTLQIPKKNISRWMRKREESSGIRGRKPGDPAMESNLTNWIKENINKGRYVTQTEIRKKAKDFSGGRDFKASKGWLQKYFRRNKLIGEALNNLLYLKRITTVKQNQST